MTLPVPPGDLLHVAVRAAIPLVGIAFFGWPAANVVFVYCVDVLASLYAVCVLTCGRLFAMEPTSGPLWWQRLWSGTQLALSALLPWVAIALPLAVTMGIVLTTAGFDWEAVLHERGLWLAAAAQFGAAVTPLLRDYDFLVEARDADWGIKRRFGLVFLRWVIVLMIGWSVLEALPGYGITIVIACTLATVALELYPNQVLRAFGAADLATPPPASARPAHGAQRKQRRH